MVAVALAAALATPQSADADAVTRWNAVAASLPAPNPFVQARTLAMAQLAVFDAVNAITNEYEPYHFTTDAPAGASADAAAVEAAYLVLRTLVPAAAATLDAERAASLAEIPDGDARDDGIAIGEAAGAAILALRASDGSAPPTTYLPTSTAPGVWQLTENVPPTPPCAAGVLYHWQNVTPFGLPNVADFMAPPPPAMSSTRYAKDYNEVKKVGSAISTDRPPDRADVVLFYAASSPGYLFSSVARQLAEAQGRSMSHTARALALIMMATSDSLVVSFASKYHYNLWRPETAIRNGDADGNKKTAQDLGFGTFISTPCFPSYPSNHASGSNGALEIIRRIYGAGGHAITLTNTAVASIAHITLNYEKLKTISDDIDDARVYGGIHFRFDQDEGVHLGRNVAKHVIKNQLRRLRHK
jgi:hypothetical protein